MTGVDPYVFLNGMSAGFCFLSCLVCGLQLCFGIFSERQFLPTTYSRPAGIVMFCVALSTFLYSLSEIFASVDAFYIAAVAMDSISLIGLAHFGYLVYSGHIPSWRVVLKVSSPFLAIAVLFLLFPVTREYLPHLAILTLILQYVFYCIKLRPREKSLEKIYADPESHSLKWLFNIILLLCGWWGILLFTRFSDTDIWFDVAAYFYMTFFVLLGFGKVSKYREPVSRETAEQIEQLELQENSAAPFQASFLPKLLKDYMEQHKYYLNPDLTIDNLASSLGVTPRELSAVLHNEMHTSFYNFVNEYRVERAKELLETTDDKIEHILTLCGFNSRQTFCRIFSKVTGKTPSEWRNG